MEERTMALILIEEVLAGLDEVKALLEQAVMILEDMIEDIHPDLGQDVKDVLTRTLLSPLQSRMTVLETLLVNYAGRAE
jgi:hypothetical protein